MNVKGQKSLDDLKALWETDTPRAVCSNPSCPNLDRIHIHAETITINTLIVGGELPPELKSALAAKLAA